MTEAEWLACTDPKPMLNFLNGKASDRKLRLFAVACCRRISHLFTDDRCRTAVAVAERFADAGAEQEELNDAAYAADAAREAALGTTSSAADAAHAAFGAAAPDDFDQPSYVAAREAPPASAAAIASSVAAPGGDTDSGWEVMRRDESAAQCRLLRDIFGSPFRPTTGDPAWLTPAVVSLAQTIYDERAFVRTPELADALERAGCDNADVLNHCRNGGEHVRGCWAVDLVLGKS